MKWQDKGDFLAVKADRHRKSKKQTYTSFEFFRIRDKGVPVETYSSPFLRPISQYS